MKTLKRRLSPANVWALALGCIIGWGAYVMPGNTFLPAAGPAGTAIAIGAAALVMIVIAINYSYMIARSPAAGEGGGGFLYAHCAFGRTHGFICAWFLSLSYLAIVPLNATALALVGRNLLGGLFAFGPHYEVAGYDVYLGEILLALTALAVVAALSMRGVKFAGAFQTVLAIVLVAGVVIVAGAALASPTISWENLIPAFHPGTSELSGILAVFAVAPWAFVGFDTVPQSSEEIAFSSAKTRALMIAAIVLGALVYIVLNTVTAAVVPDGYASWTDYIDDLGNLNGLQSLPTFNAAHQLLGDAGLFFLGASVVCAILSGIVGFYMATSRLLFFMARRNVLPAWFGHLNKHSVPGNSILFVMCISCIAPFFGRTALGWIVDMSSLGAAIGYGYTCAATLKFAHDRRLGKLVFTGCTGLVFSIIFAVLLLIPLPGFSSSLSIPSYVCLGIWTLLGFAFYVVMRRKGATSLPTAGHQGHDE